MIKEVEHRGVGRPEKLTPDEKIEVYRAFEKYIEDEDYPLVTGFCNNNKVARKYNVTRDNINDWPQFSTLIKKALSKQEEFTEVQASIGKMPPAWAIFKLKQPAFGWTDKQQVEHSGEIGDGSIDPKKRVAFETWLENQNESK